MPLLVGRSALPSPEPAPEPSPRGFVDISWTAPDGREWDLMRFDAETGVVVLDDGVGGLGSTPRAVTRQPLATGGTMARWSYADERIITLPLLLFAPTHAEFLTLRRELTKAFTRTTPAAGSPRPGTLRVTRSDGSWREIRAIYLDGFGWTDESGRGVTHDVAVVQLVAPDPYWYGPTTVAVDFKVQASGRNYLNPYETVSGDSALGASTIEVQGDEAAFPVWEITGPATSVTAAIVGGPSWTFGEVKPGERITIDVARSTVTDQTGANRIGDLVWPKSTLFSLPPGSLDIFVDIQGGVPGDPPSGVRLSYRPRLETA